ncbi:hypothetical protein [uncultured Winogradskyella sp.]|uniref:hypothetical protein n=1 Tax=uncultured Winogradskyella sp. TaxID=395353 RepID=UPI00260F5606|nr:hypothetical protein [uncultured Winogradskyella sp.]
MNEISSYIKNITKSYKDIVLFSNKMEIVLSKEQLYKIIIFSYEERVSISYEWKAGILGHFLLKKDYLIMEDLLKKIKEGLISKDYHIDILVRNDISSS